MPGTSGAYRRGLIEAYEGEVAGEAYFRGLERHFPAHAPFLSRCAALERATAARMKTLLDRHGLDATPAEALVRAGLAEADRDGHRPWRELMQDSVASYPAYVGDFEALAALAPPPDAADLAALVEHERRLIEWMREVLAQPG